MGAFTPVTPGAHVVDLSIFDRGDDTLDSTVLFNGLSFFAASAGSPAGATCLVGLDAAPTMDTTAPAVTLQTPATASKVSSTPTFEGSFGTAYEDLPEVTVNIYAGSDATGTPVETLNASDDATSWQAPASQPLAPGTYTAQAQQSDLAGNLGLSAAHTFVVRPALEHSGTIVKPTVREQAHGRIMLTIHNPNAVAALATLTLTRKSATIGHGTVRVPSHRSAVLTLRLSKSARSYLGKHKSLEAKATVILTAQGISKTKVQTVTIKAAA